MQINFVSRKHKMFMHKKKLTVPFLGLQSKREMLQALTESHRELLPCLPSDAKWINLPETSKNLSESSSEASSSEDGQDDQEVPIGRREVSSSTISSLIKQLASSPQSKQRSKAKSEVREQKQPKKRKRTDKASAAIQIPPPRLHPFSCRIKYQNKTASLVLRDEFHYFCKGSASKPLLGTDFWAVKKIPGRLCVSGGMFPPNPTYVLHHLADIKKRQSKNATFHFDFWLRVAFYGHIFFVQLYVCLKKKPSLFRSTRQFVC